MSVIFQSIRRPTRDIEDTPTPSLVLPSTPSARRMLVGRHCLKELGEHATTTIRTVSNIQHNLPRIKSDHRRRCHETRITLHTPFALGLSRVFWGDRHANGQPARALYLLRRCRLHLYSCLSNTVRRRTFSTMNHPDCRLNDGYPPYPLMTITRCNG